MSKLERLAYLATIVALLGVFAVRGGAAQDAKPPVDEKTSAWGSGHASKEFAAALRVRLDDLSDLDGTSLIYGWALLIKEFGLIYDGHMLSERPDMAPCRFGWYVDCSALGGESWVLRNNVIDEKDIARGSIENEVVEVPKRTLLRFITEAGVSETPPAQADVEQSVLFVSFGQKAMLINLSSGDYYRLPFDRPSSTLLDRSPDKRRSGLKSFAATAIEPSSFW
jgi:hypothetical protein